MTTGARLPGRRRVWIQVAAVALAAVAGTLASPPSALGQADNGGRLFFPALASAAIVALAILPFALWRGAAHPRIWMALGVIALTLGISSFYAGGYAQRTCTAQYGSNVVVIGTELTTLGATYRQANPELSSADLLFDAAGAPERLWTPASIERCRAFISSTYFLWIPFLVIGLVAAAQAVPSTLRPPVQPQTRMQPSGPDAPVRYDVFLSYRHDVIDSGFAIQLLDALEADGYRVAIDQRDFLANAGFLQEMERCVRESRFTVAIISSRYLDSDNCQEEAAICKVLDMGDRKRRLIPFVIERVPMPAWLYGIVGIDGTQTDPLVDPLDKLEGTLGPPQAAETTQPDFRVRN